MSHGYVFWTTFWWLSFLLIFFLTVRLYRQVLFPLYRSQTVIFDQNICMRQFESILFRSRQNLDRRLQSKEGRGLRQRWTFHRRIYAICDSPVAWTSINSFNISYHLFLFLFLFIFYCFLTWHDKYVCRILVEEKFNNVLDISTKYRRPKRCYPNNEAVTFAVEVKDHGYDFCSKCFTINFLRPSIIRELEKLHMYVRTRGGTRGVTRCFDSTGKLVEFIVLNGCAQCYARN